MEGFRKYAFEMGSGAMIYVHTKFHKDWFRHSEVKRAGGIKETQKAWRSHKTTLGN
jgi:hypothetical protein